MCLAPPTTHVCCALFERRIEAIGSLEIQGNFQRKQITLVDNDGVKSTFLLWGEQVLLSNLFRYYSLVFIFWFFLYFVFCA